MALIQRKGRLGATHYQDLHSVLPWASRDSLRSQGSLYGDDRLGSIPTALTGWPGPFFTSTFCGASRLFPVRLLATGRVVSPYCTSPQLAALGSCYSFSRAVVAGRQPQLSRDYTGGRYFRPRNADRPPAQREVSMRRVVAHAVVLGEVQVNPGVVVSPCPLPGSPNPASSASIQLESRIGHSGTRNKNALAVAPGSRANALASGVWRPGARAICPRP